MRARAHWAGVAALAILAGGCEEVGPSSALEIESTGDVLGRLFLDLNGNAVEDAADQTVPGWLVRLVGRNGGVLASARTDSLGFFDFREVPVGEVRVDVERAQLGDSLELFGLVVENPIILLAGDAVTLNVGLSYPTVTLGAVDTLPLGRRVFVDGIALNAVVTNGPRELHLRSGTDALRVTSIVRTPVGVGDSVRVLGRRGSEAGWPILTGGAILRLPPPVDDPLPLSVTTGAAATAQGGALGADLVRVRSADLLEARNEGDDVVLTVDDGTGPVEIVLRSFLGSDASFFDPDRKRIRETTGLLVPWDDGGGLRWRLVIRSADDLRVEDVPAPTGAGRASGGQ